MEPKKIIEYGRTPAVIKPQGSEIIEAGANQARYLKDVIEKGKLYTMIQGRKYVNVEGWQVLGTLMGCKALITSVDEIPEGYRARAEIINKDGQTVGVGLGICSRKEKNWALRDEYALMSMAQTRAVGKAYRLNFAWVMALANYQTTPAEEVTP